MEAVAADALGIELFGDGVMVGDRPVLAMERRVETGHLGQVPACAIASDRSQIVRLMQRRERGVAFEARQHLVRYKDGLMEFGPAVHDAMAGDRIAVTFSRSHAPAVRMQSAGHASSFL